ncbi:MAG: sarcosine oxidase subunit delta [Hyphomicrobiaceae bacterium]
MRIPCCHCGERGHEEFAYLGDATLRRPSDAPGGPDAARWHDYVYQRDNPSGPHRELWQHTGGCRAWLVVTRDTRTHEVIEVRPARAVALADGGAAS